MALLLQDAADKKPAGRIAKRTENNCQESLKDSRPLHTRSSRKKSEKSQSDLDNDEMKDGKDLGDSSLIVINDSEPICASQGFPDGDVQDNVPVRYNKEICTAEDKTDHVLHTHNENMQADEDITYTAPAEKEISDEKSTTDSGKLSASSSNDSLSVRHVPQNVLETVGFTQQSASASKSDSSGKVSASECQSGDTSKHLESHTKNDMEPVNTGLQLDGGKEKSESEPLFSWTQKLQELSQSPRLNLSGKTPLSQESPRGRSRSPFKSPKRTKKKITNENEEKGALDKWVIRSPLKSINVSDTGAEEIVANLSLVEETQSPSKFVKTVEKLDGTSPSIMETPPKNVLEIISINHSNSSRKLFSSQDLPQSQVEDSNLVPASPSSKSWKIKPGTPVIKLKKLSEFDIQKFSPSRRDGRDEEKLTPSRKDHRKGPEALPAKCVLDQPDNKSHEHDDFSVFKPLETDKTGVAGEFWAKSKNPSEHSVLNTTESWSDKTEDVKEGNEKSGSESLYSEDWKSQNGEKFPSDQLNLSQTSESSETTQSLQDSELGSETRHGKSTPGRGRKRKQISPQKKTPENNKQKKIAAVETRRSARKTGQRKNHEKGKAATNETVNLRNDTVGEVSGNITETKDDLVQSEKMEGRGKKSRSKTSVKAKALKENKPEHKDSDVTAVETRKDGEPDVAIVQSTGADEDTTAAQDVVQHTDEDDRAPGKLDDNKVTEETNTAPGMSETEVIADLGVSEQRTPETKTAVERQPRRRSTTKHKKEIAQKFVNKRTQEVLINDSNSNLDMEDETQADEAAEDGISRKHESSVQTSEKGSKNSVGSEIRNIPDVSDMNEVEMECVSSTDTAKANESLVSDSDDDIPLMHMSQNLAKKEKARKHKGETSLTSSLSNKLRSNIQKSRLGSAEKKQTSPKARKSVSLAIKRTRTRRIRQKETNSGHEKIVEAVKDAEEKQVKPDALEETLKECESNSNETKLTMNSNNPELGLDKKNTETSKLENDETPRKAIETTHPASLASGLVANSDSKLILGSRKFNRKGGLARRSILKTSSVGSDDGAGSPVRFADFHPITVNRIYSPTASPSASILKKRRLSDDVPSDSSSPPAKVMFSIMIIILSCLLFYINRVDIQLLCCTRCHSFTIVVCIKMVLMLLIR